MFKYFTDEEFKKCTPSCSITDMDENFMLLLDELREKCGIPLVINSAYRSKEYDISKGRSGDGAHTKGKAIDLRCNDSINRHKILKNAIKLGFNRIGIANSFIHLDIDDSLVQNVCWLYS